MRYGKIDTPIEPEIITLLKNKSNITLPSDTEKKFKSNMNKIVDVLPITDEQKKEINTKIKNYGRDFVAYAQFQTREEEDLWSAALLPIATMIIDNSKE